MALTDSLISYWKFDEASGNALDSHGTNDLTDNNTVGSATGKIGNARDFELGNAEYFSKASNSDLQTGDIDFTITCWVKLESNGQTMQVVTKYSDASNEYAIIYDNVNAKFYFYSGTSFTSVASTTPTPIATATWYFIAVWFNASANSINIKVNNGTTYSNTVTPTSAGSANFKIGLRDDSTQYWDGLIDEVGFWKRLLTSDELTSLYNGGSGLAYPFSSSASAVRLAGPSKLVMPGLIGGALVL